MSYDLLDKPSEDQIDELVDSLIEEDEEDLEEDTEEVRDSLKQESALFNETLTLVGSKLETEFKDFSKRRGRKEREWIQAMIQYNDSYADKNDKDQIEGNSTPFIRKPKINTTAHKCNMAIARMMDIQFPLGGDFNFHLDPPADPFLEGMIGDDTPVQNHPEYSKGEVAKASLMERIDSAKRMQMLIQNQLTRCQYSRQAKSAITDWVILGTAVIKGPVLKQYKNRSYQNFEDSEGGLQSQKLVDMSTEPSAEYVDLRFFYPDPDVLLSEQLTKAYEIKFADRTEFIKLSKNPAFMKNRIKNVLEKKPDGQNNGDVFDINGIFSTDYSLRDKYIVKIYNGPLPEELYPYLEMDIDPEESLFEVFGEVWMVQGEIIRVSVSPLDEDDRIPYHIVVWEKDFSSLMGHGMPWKMRHQAHVINATWQMVLDNAGLSAGPQVALNKEMVEPANGKWDVEPFKLWWLTEYGARIQDAVQFTNVPNNQQPLTQIIDMAMMFADIESDTPMIAQNMMPQANNNTSHTALVMTEANVTQRELSMAWDNNITVPMIERFYDYNMQYSSDPKIKGDYEVHVGAATQRIDNQIIAQDIERILAMAEADPMYKVQIDPQAAFRKWASSTRVGPEILRSPGDVEEEIRRMEEQAAEAGPPADQVRAEAAMLREQTRAQQLEADMQLQQAAAEQDRLNQELERELKVLKMEMQEREIAFEQWKLEQERQLMLIQMADKRDTTLAQLMKDMDVATMNNETARINKQIDLAKFNKQAELKAQYGTGVSK